MTLHEPHETQVLLGHERAADDFMHTLIGERAHHAWLIHGPEGIGKTTFAYHIAHHILSGGQQKIGKLDAKLPAYKLVTGQTHPDLRVITRPIDEKTGIKKNEIPVESIRGLNEFFHLTSAYNNWRVAIIADAECLSRSAANALLKILEEPPQRAMIIMTAISAGQLLPTLRSRCRKLALFALSDKHMHELIKKDYPQIGLDDAALIVRLAEGSFGRAAALIDHDGQELYASLIGHLAAMPKLNLAAIQSFADQVARKSELARFDLVAGFLLGWLQSLVLCAATGQADDSPGSNAQLLRRFAAWQPLEHWLKVWDKVRQMLAAGEGAHLDRKLVLVNSIIAITRPT
jgi:DNA polymerase III subunit delta'